MLLHSYCAVCQAPPCGGVLVIIIIIIIILRLEEKELWLCIRDSFLFGREW